MGILSGVIAASVGAGLTLAPGVVLATSVPLHGPGSYLALGDSLAAGCTATCPTPTRPITGYLPTSGYVPLLAAETGLTPSDLGCPGETTASLIDGGICTYTPAKSQLNAAETFLETNKRTVKLVTIDIGANDLAPCITSSINTTCAAAATVTASLQLKSILTGLKRADPAARIVGMNYYDPVLAAWLESGFSGKLLAIESALYAAAFNRALDTVYAEFGIPVANVQSAFQTFDFYQYKLLPPSGVYVPENVYEICTLTYTCITSGGNPHPLEPGYGVIAEAFAQALA